MMKKGVDSSGAQWKMNEYGSPRNVLDHNTNAGQFEKSHDYPMQGNNMS